MKVFFQPKYSTSVKVNINKRDIEGVGTTPVDNILKMYALANADELNAASWYHDAHNHAVELANISGLSVEQTSGVIAIISPKQRWEVNVSMAYLGVVEWMLTQNLGLTQSQLSNARVAQALDTLLTHYSTYANRDNLAAQSEIQRSIMNAVSNSTYTVRYDGSCNLSPSNQKFSDKARAIMNGENVGNVGQKVYTFWQTILSPDTCHLPTIDSVATSIALGGMSYFPGTYSLGQGKGNEPSPQYALLQDAYRQAAVKAGIPVTAMQAITWTTCRRLKTENRQLTGRTLHSHFMQYCGGENTEAHGFVQHLADRGISL